MYILAVFLVKIFEKCQSVKEICKVSFIILRSTIFLITSQNFNIQTCFSIFLWFKIGSDLEVR